MDTLSLPFSGSRVLRTGPAAVFLILLVFSGCQYWLPPLKVGFVGSFTGEGASLGSHARRGFQMVFHEQKLKYGQNGRKLEVVFRDDRSDPARALEIFKELESQDCRLVVSFQTSESSLEAYRYAASRDIFVISGTPDSTGGDRGDDLMLRLVPSNEHQGRALAQAALRDGRRRIINVTTDYDPSYTAGFVEGFNRAFTAGGGTVLGTVPWHAGKENGFTGRAEALRGKGADSLGPIILNALDASLLAHEIRKIDSRLGIYLAPWILAENLDQSEGKEFEGFTALSFADLESTRTEFRQFRESYAATYSRDPLFPAVLGFEAGHLMSFLLSHGKELHPEGIRKFIRNTSTLSGIQGPYLLDSRGDSQRSPAVYRFTQGRWKIIRS